MVFKTAFYVFIGTSWRKLNFLKKSTPYKNFVGAVKIGFYCPKKHLQAKNSFWKMFNSRNMFLNWTKIFQLFSRTSFGGVVRIPPFVSIGSFRRKKFFLETLVFFYVFQTISKDVSVFCQKKIVGLSKLHFTCPCDPFEERVFWKNYGLLITIGVRSTNFQHFVHLFSTGFSKLHSTCSKEQIKEIKIIWE